MNQPARNRPQIRPAAPEDLACIVQLERATVTAPHWPAADYADILKPLSEPPQSEQMRRCLFVAADTAAEQTLQGFAVGRIVGGGEHAEAELESVAVHADAQRQGLGTALCRAVLRWAAAAGARHIQLEVRAHSAGAIQLYGGLGFVATGRRPAYYSAPLDDAVLMHLSLWSTALTEAETDPAQGVLDV